MVAGRRWLPDPEPVRRDHRAVDGDRPERQYQQLAAGHRQPGGPGRGARLSKHQHAGRDARRRHVQPERDDRLRLRPGRPFTQTLGPVHTANVGGTATSVRTATWNYYDDADHEYLTAQGYATQDGSGGWTVFTAVNPVSIEVTNPDGQETNDIQASMESALGLTADTDAVGDISLSEADLSPSAVLAEMAAMQATLSQSTPLPAAVLHRLDDLPILPQATRLDPGLLRHPRQRGRHGNC